METDPLSPLDDAPPESAPLPAAPLGRTPSQTLLILATCFTPLTACGLAAGPFRAPGLPLLGMVASLLVSWLVLLCTGEGWRSVGLRRSPLGWALLPAALGATVLLFVVSLAAGMALQSATGLEPNMEAFEPVKNQPGALAVLLLLVWTTAAFGEEMLFRGVLLSGLGELFGKTKAGWFAALMASSALFGMGHVYQGWAGVLLTGVVGFGLGLCFLLSRRNLWLPILVHGLYDTAGVLVFCYQDAIAAAVN